MRAFFEVPLRFLGGRIEKKTQDICRWIAFSNILIPIPEPRRGVAKMILGLQRCHDNKILNAGSRNKCMDLKEIVYLDGTVVRPKIPTKIAETRPVPEPVKSRFNLLRLGQRGCPLKIYVIESWHHGASGGSLPGSKFGGIVGNPFAAISRCRN